MCPRPRPAELCGHGWRVSASYRRAAVRVQGGFSIFPPRRAQCRCLPVARVALRPARPRRADVPTPNRRPLRRLTRDNNDCQPPLPSAVSRPGRSAGVKRQVRMNLNRFWRKVASARTRVARVFPCCNGCVPAGSETTPSRCEVGRVTPCAPLGIPIADCGAHRVTRPARCLGDGSGFGWCCAKAAPPMRWRRRPRSRGTATKHPAVPPRPPPHRDGARTRSGTEAPPGKWKRTKDWTTRRDGEHSGVP